MAPGRGSFRGEVRTSRPAGVRVPPGEQTPHPHRSARTRETSATMPKSKTHSGAKKRFRVTGTGKVMRRRANRNHLLEHKPSKRTRRLDGAIVVSKHDEKKIKKLL